MSGLEAGPAALRQDAASLRGDERWILMTTMALCQRDRALSIGWLHGHDRTRDLAELLIDLEADPARAPEFFRALKDSLPIPR